MSPSNNDEPRYGRRSQDWTPQHNSEGSSGERTTPWPQYGQVNPDLASGAPSHVGAVPPVGGTTPQATGGGIYAGPTPKLPSRRGATLTLVFGLILSFVVAPMVFVGGLIMNGSLMDKVASARVLESGDSVTIDSSGSYYVVPSSTDVYACTLTGADGVGHPMEAAPLATGFQIYDLTPGTYTLTCEGEGVFTLEGMSFYSQSDVLAVGLSAFGWASLVGVIGIVVAIVGIIRLVGVNRRRREVLRASGRW
ncbi:hypothetical protein [Schaalia suimastitidis]|uniref:hypothetical protein n=1 Tax=Schaalia suimastitidis TaxID=121163 RepID=UPI00041EAC9F|nr:hypothetical protein [Schaalia suimastitidis]